MTDFPSVFVCQNVPLLDFPAEIQYKYFTETYCSRSEQEEGKTENRMKKRLLSWLLCLSFVLCIMPVQAKAEDDAAKASSLTESPAVVLESDIEPCPDDALPSALPDALPETAREEQEDPVPEFVRGYIPEEDGLIYPQTLSLNPDAAILQNDSAAIPPRYTAQYTSVKNQGVNGLCWSFATNAIIETWLLKNYPDLDPETVDFSEMHMAYALSDHSGNTYGYDRAPGDGGNRNKSSSYLMRGNPLDSSGSRLCIGGAVLDSYDRYSTSALPDRALSTTLYNKPKIIVPKNTIFIGGKKAEGEGASDAQIKEASPPFVWRVPGWRTLRKPSPELNRSSPCLETN